MATSPKANAGGGGFNRPLLGAIIGLGGTIAQGIFNRKQSKKNTKRTNQANMELAKYAYEKDLEMWERNNKYNSPEAQMKRLQEAGLNRNLVYGSGNVAGNTSGQTPHYQNPRMDYMGQLPVDVGGAANALQTYQDIRLKEAQIDNVKASTVNTGQRTTSELIKGSNYLTDGQKKQLELSTARELQQTHIQAGRTELEIAKQKLTTEQKRQISMDLKNEYQKMMNDWAERGVTAQDAAWVRMAARAADNLGIDISSWITDALKKTEQYHKSSNEILTPEFKY